MITRACIIVCVLAGCGIARAAGIVSSGTNGEEAVRLRAEFLAQALPISYETHVKAGAHFHLSWIELTGRTKSFATRHSAQELIYAFWPWLDDPAHAPEATILLLGLTGRKMMTPQKLSYTDKTHSGNWSDLADSCIDECKIECRGTLNQPNWWYPHQILFDRETVLIESKTSAVVRANYIAAMQKALADPKIRTENPLAVREILSLLNYLDRKASVSTFLDYIFFDMYTGGNYRLKKEPVSVNDIYNSENGTFTGLACLAGMGAEYFPAVINRFAMATHEERSTHAGGGAIPMLAIFYFHAAGCRENAAVEAIHQYKVAHKDLTDEQKASLDEIMDAINTKKYRPSFMKGSDWAAPSNAVTNSPPIK